MSGKRKKHRKWFLLILIMAVTAGVIRHYVNERREEAHRAEMRAMSEARREAYKDLMPKKMPGLCKDLPVPGTVTVNAEVKWEEKKTIIAGQTVLSQHWRQTNLLISCPTEGSMNCSMNGIPARGKRPWRSGNSIWNSTVRV